MKILRDEKVTLLLVRNVLSVKRSHLNSSFFQAAFCTFGKDSVFLKDLIGNTVLRVSYMALLIISDNVSSRPSKSLKSEF